MRRALAPLMLVTSVCGGPSVSLDDYLREAHVICADATQRKDALIAPVFAAYLPTIGEDPTDEELIGLHALSSTSSQTCSSFLRQC